MEDFNLLSITAEAFNLFKVFSVDGDGNLNFLPG